MGSHRPHDAVQRLNEHHREELLVVARTFGGVPDCTDVRALSIDERGISIEVTGPSGAVTVDVLFLGEEETSPRNASRRLRFRRLVAAAQRQI